MSGRKSDAIAPALACNGNDRDQLGVTHKAFFRAVRKCCNTYEHMCKKAACLLGGSVRSFPVLLNLASCTVSKERTIEHSL